MVKQLSLFGFAASIFIGCTADHITNPVCFESEILPIFQSNCTSSGCHNSTDKEDGKDLSSYAGISAFLDDEGKKKLINVLRGDKGEDLMPPAPQSPLPESSIELIIDWLDGGYKNTTGCDTAVCDTSAMSFSQDIQPIFNAYCISCHSGAAPASGRDFTTYQGVFDNTGVITGAIKHEIGFIPMPDGTGQIPACSISKIEAWIAQGALNN